MNLSLLAHVAPLAVAAVLSVVLVLAALPQRASRDIRWFMVFSAGIFCWTVGYALEIAVPDLAGKIYAAKFQYLGVASVPGAWLLFTVGYASAGWPRWTGAATLLVPLLTLGLAWSNEAHGLIWSATELRPGPGFDLLLLEYGPWFWVHAAYSYLCLLTSAVLLARVIVVRPPLFRRQAILLLGGALAPWGGNAVYLAGISPNSLDLTVFGFAISGALAGWALLRWQLLAVGPVARDTLVEAMAEGVVVIDEDGRIVDVNPSATRILGFDVGDMIGRPADALLGHILPPMVPRQGGLATHELGQEGRTYDCRLDPLADRGDRFRGWTLVLSNVTRRMEESAALDRARRLAEDAARAQRTFLTNMNHELRTPLNGVLGMLQVLDLGDMDPINRHYVRQARRSGEDLLQLVDKILDFTSIESGDIRLARDPLDLNKVVSDRVEPYRADAEAKGLALHFTPADDLPGDLIGDAARIGQIVDALVSNAVKFTDTGHVHVRVSRRESVDGRTPVRLEVFDTGIGIPESSHREVFHSFVQVDGSNTRAYEGTGLGLSSADKLVARMGGRLHVDSEVGRGSRFWFVLPMERAEGEADEADPGASADADRMEEASSVDS